MSEFKQEFFFKVTCDELVQIVENDNFQYNDKFHSIEEICLKMSKDLENGNIICKKEHSRILNLKKTYEKESKEIFGSNVHDENNKKTFFSIILENTKDRSLFFLFIGAIISLTIGSFKYFTQHEEFVFLEGFSILTAIGLIVTISSTMEYSQERIFQKIEEKKTSVEVKIIENGIFKTKNNSDIIVGDLIFFEPGDILSADLLMVTNTTVYVDESFLTGESIEIIKSAENPILFSGSCIKQGSGKGIVLAVGKNSTKGKILANMEKKHEPTPLQIKTNDLADSLINRSFYVALFIFLIRTVKCFLSNNVKLQCFTENIVDSIALAVTIIPEGLFMSTTMALSFGSKRLLKENNLVRDLSACEKMNNVEYLCTDKTGTLTYNQLKLRSYYTRRRKFFQIECKDFIHHDEQHFMINTIKNIILNSTSFKNQNGIYTGSRIEGALLQIIEQMGIDIEKIRKETKIYYQQCFTSEKMYMTTIVENRSYEECGSIFEVSNESKKSSSGTKQESESQVDEKSNLKSTQDSDHQEAEKSTHKKSEELANSVENSANEKVEDSKNKTREFQQDSRLSKKYIVLYKGIPEKIIQKCEFEISDDELILINRKKIEKFSESESKISQIRLATAFSMVDSPEKEFLDINNAKNLVFSGCFSFEDPLRKDVDEKIMAIKNAGIKVVMLTGDGVETSKHIAEICRIYDKDDEILTGKKFRKMTEEEINDKIEKVRIIARATPNDKKKFVELLQKRNKIVAVTGDGANDGPALKLADVGFSMGLQSSDIAKEASSIVLLKDDFESIMSAISWGRCVNDSIRKFLQLQFTATCSTILLVVFVIFSSQENDSFFKPIQLLWINLYMDAFSSISLTSDRPIDSHLTRKPEKVDAPIFTEYMRRFVTLMTIYITTIIMFLYFYKFSLTFKFTTFYFCLISTQICSRSLSNRISPLDNLIDNKYLLVVNISVIITHILIVEKFNVLFFTEPLHVSEWLSCFFLAFSLFPYFHALRKIKILK